jgi:nucleotide-binding universal stress UspA family protein
MADRPLILIPLDGTAEARTALPAARRIAGYVQAELAVLHVRAEPAPAADLPELLGLDPAERADLALEQAAGEPPAEIVRTARDREVWLVVMTSTAEPSPETPKIGGTAAAVLEAIGCNVLVVRPGQAEPRRTLSLVRHILLPLEGSPGAAAAVAPAAELARRLGARLDLLHIATLHQAQPQETGTLTAPRYLDAPEHEWPGWADEFRRRFGPAGAELPPAEVRLHVVRGDPGAEIIRHARDRHSDLIAIAWHQSLAAGRAEIVKHLLHTAPCPLLFVRTGTRTEAPS